MSADTQTLNLKQAANLLVIFPFNFSVIPDATARGVVPIAVTIALVFIAVGLGVGALVRFIRLIVNLSKA